MEHYNGKIVSETERINEMEVELTAFNAKRSVYQDNADLEVKRVGECTLLTDETAKDSIYYNRIKGFGIKDIDKIDDMLDMYYSKEITPCFDKTPNHTNMETTQALSNRGFVCAEQLVFLSIEPYLSSYSNDEIKIVNVNEKNVLEFLELISRSNNKEISLVMAIKKAAYYTQANFHNYIAYMDGEVAGMGSLFVKGDEGYIANDFTFPSFRGKGVQKALLTLDCKL
ncbi:GNAT family N-acetyltransferase [Virgibacillus flavescens]|uniref:GNAT family N-acetyltransferase n=1 Tax=Virgibacillus flavescens TaxID=1611422 RepID=UPI003D32B8CC